MEFDKAGAQVVVVSFGSRDAAAQWRQETSCQYPILIDHKRQLYNFFGMKISFSQVFHTDILVYYAEQKASGREFPKSFVGDDVHQMGGDVVLSCSGKLCLIYRSTLSTDRPSAALLLQHCSL